MLTKEDVIGQIAELAKSVNANLIDQDCRIDAETNIARDLKLDSLATMDFVLALEIKFDTIIPIDSMAGVETVGQLAGLILSQTNPAPLDTTTPGTTPMDQSQTTRMPH